MSKLKYLKFIIPSYPHLASQICTVSHVEYFVNFQEIIFGGGLNVTSFSKLSHGHFPANITKFSEQLCLTPFPSYIVNEHMSN